jgi:hypothetical protein
VTPAREVESVETRARQFASDPVEFFGHSYYAMHHVDPDALSSMQLAALRFRFTELRERIPVLSTIAGEQGIADFARLEDVVPLLFQHSVYKSYPASLLLKGRFRQLTHWLDRLTTAEVSTAPVDDCESIDEWLDVLDAHTDLRVAHSSGTTGTMSFLPRSRSEWDKLLRAVRCGLFMFADPEYTDDHSAETFDIVWPAFRSGRTGFMRVAGLALEHFAAGDEARFHALHRGRLSADAMFLAGRIQAARARGELEQLDIGPALRARADDFQRTQRELVDAMPEYFARVIETLRGERVWVFGTWNILYDLARSGLDRGLRGVFSPESVITTGGGAKGMVQPDGWEQVVCEFAGVPQMQRVYGMTELMALNHACPHDRYHLEPWIVPFVLDPADGSPLPREGERTGRGAFFDLMAETCWGGFITGDEITLDFSACDCGQTSPHLGMRIERYGEKQGGDDKITCAASDQAHRAALEFVTAHLA